MFNKFICTVASAATVATVALSFYVAPASAAQVRVNRNCMTYNDAGQQVGSLNFGYFTVVSYGRFLRSGENSAKVWADFSAAGKGKGYVNIATRCLQSSGGRVIEYN